MRVSITSLLLLAGAGAATRVYPRAVLNGPCSGAGSAPGVCISTSSCEAGGGQHILNACPGTPDNIRCCTKASCGTGGSCGPTSSCAGTAVAGFCPGPTSFQCCEGGGDSGDAPAPPLEEEEEEAPPAPAPPADAGDNPGFAAPKIPAVGDCKAVAVEGAQVISGAFPGRIAEIGCKRACACAKGNSNHCCGLANDLMTSKLGTATDRGIPIAEFIMNNADRLNLKNVIWGQKIWSPTRDEIKPWPQWRGMEDRGSVTANHFDHVHISYN